MALIQGSADNDTLDGDLSGADSDAIVGYLGDDTLRGLLGDDSLEGGYGADSLLGGDGNDTLNGDYGSWTSSGGDDNLSGEAGDDSLVGGVGNDSLDGGGGNDTLRGGCGTDTLTGGTGADLFVADEDIAGAAEVDRVTDFSLDDGDRIDISALGISEFATLQQFLTDAGDDTLLTFLRDGVAQGLRLVGISDPATLTASQFILSTETTDDDKGGNSQGDDLFGGLGNDSLYGGYGSDRLYGEAGDDHLNAGYDNDTVFGGAGSDLIYGAYGLDSLVGGEGNDTIWGDDASDHASGNQDELLGGAGDDSLGGGDGNDNLHSGSGNDTVRGGRGTDTLTGGTGADLFVADEDIAGAAEVDHVTDFSAADGDRIDISALGIGEFATLQQLLADAGDDTLLTFLRDGVAQGLRLVGIGDPATLTASQFVLCTETMDDGKGGNSLDDDLFGGLGNDSLYGDYGNDRLFGEAGDDHLEAGGDSDTVFGGAGSDLIYGADGLDSLVGGDGNDTIWGDTGNDTLVGGGGDDSVVGGNNTDTVVFSGSWADYTISGTPGTSFILTDRRGSMSDGVDRVSEVEIFTFANGTFTPDQLLNEAPLAADDANPGDAVTEAGAVAGDPAANGNVLANDTDANSPLGDSKTVVSARAGTEAGGGTLIKLGSALTIAGTLGNLRLNADGSYAYTLNNSDPDTQTLAAGASASDVFTYRMSDAGGLQDTAQLIITITGANDTPSITSNGSGATAAISLAENTTAVTTVTATDPDAGTALSYSIIGGADSARFAINATTGVLTFLSAPNFEVPTDAGGNNVYGVRVQVSDGSLVDAQSISVTVTNQSMGLTITGTAAKDVLAPPNTGVTHPATEEDDTIFGLAGDDLLNGGLGNDTMTGGAGNDTYVVDATGDRVFETTTPGSIIDAGGIDTVQSAVTFNLDATAAVRFVERLTLTGTANINATGNALANTLTGAAGNNVLNGGLGSDTMTGGAGNDTYVVNATGDRVFETTAPGSIIDAGGIDTVRSAVTFNLDATAAVRFVERLTLTGTANINATGNALANRLTGADGNNVLNGGLGSDTMTGGVGNDTFVFSSALGGGNIDRVSDFNVVDDRFRLDDTFFAGLLAGGLATGAFASNLDGKASNATQRIIYETDTGHLYFDADGNGLGARVQFATLSSGLALTATDFIVF